MKKIITKIAPAMNSTSGYCHEILLLQPRHFPRRARKLKIGNSSSQESFLPQDIHFERPPRVTPVLKRKETTFKKLPTIAPKMKAMIDEKISMRSDDGCLLGANAIICRTGGVGASESSKWSASRCAIFDSVAVGCRTSRCW